MTEHTDNRGWAGGYGGKHMDNGGSEGLGASSQTMVGGQEGLRAIRWTTELGASRRTMEVGRNGEGNQMDNGGCAGGAGGKQTDSIGWAGVAEQVGRQQ